MYKKFAALLLLISTSSAAADTISLEYKGFYDRMKVLKRGEYHLVDLAFTVPDTEMCKILTGTITTESKEYPLSVSANQRLYIPFDEELKRDRALVNLGMASNASACGIGMQVRAKLNHNEYSSQGTIALMTEMDALLDALQGFPLKYFRDPIDGLTFQFDKSQVSVSIDEISKPVKQPFQLSREQLQSAKSIRFSQAPVAVSPWVK